MQEIYLNCVLMANKEIIFLGKSLGFVKDQDIVKYVLDAQEVKEALKQNKIKN